MFKKNLYSFCALLSLSCSVYAMEGLNGDGTFPSSLPVSPDHSLIGTGSGWSAFRASTASGGFHGQESDEIQVSASSSARSKSLFPNGYEKVLSNDYKVVYESFFLQKKSDSDFLDSLFHEHPEIMCEITRAMVAKLPALETELEAPKAQTVVKKEKEEEK